MSEPLYYANKQQYTDSATVLCNHQMEKQGGNYIQTFYCNLDSDKKQTEDTIKQTLTKIFTLSPPSSLMVFKSRSTSLTRVLVFFLEAIFVR